MEYQVGMRMYVGGGGCSPYLKGILKHIDKITVN